MRGIAGRVPVWALAALAACAGSLAAQDTTPVDAGMYRVWQGNLEVMRETFRETAAAIEGTTRIPLRGMTLRWREERGADGRLRSARLAVHRLASDSLVRSYTLTADGDSLRLEQADPGGEPRRWSRPGRPEALLAEQSIATLGALVRRAGRRDTTLHAWSPSADTALPVTIAFHGDTAALAVASLRATAVVGADGRMATLVIPVQAARAERFAGGTDLPPLRGMDRPAPDYTAPAGARYTAEEVRVPVTTPAGDTFSLGCTFTKPLGAGGRLPAVVTLSGSGQQDRDEDLWPLADGYRIFRQVAERLAAAGIAVLRCDDRGFGASGGPLDRATIADFADDASAKLAWLRTRPDVDPRRVALVGHSEGGMTGPIVAARDPALAALVVMAGPAKPMRAVVRDQLRWRIQSIEGLEAGERARLAAEAERQADAVVNGPGAYMAWARDWDPLPTARRVRAPTLILQGALDRQVTAGQADSLAAAVRAGGNRDVTVRVFPRLNHLFLVSPTDGSPTEYAALTDFAVPAEVLDTMAVWLQRRLRPR
jgi:hypothetical protein